MEHTYYEIDSESERNESEDEEEDEKLDTTWLDDFKAEETKYKNFYKEPVTSIMLYFIYSDQKKELIAIDTQHCLLTENRKLKHDRLIALIKEHQTHNSINYKLNSLLRYNIDLNPEEILDFVNETKIDVANNRFMTYEKYLNDIQYNDSIRMFHDLNSLYFIFIEEVSSNHTAAQHKSVTNTKRIKLTTKHRKTMRNNHKKNLKIKKEIS